MDRVHNQERFYKYTSASTAIKILERSAVRYSSPLIFNDPFDIQAGLHFDFDIHRLHEKALGRIRELATSSDRPSVDEDDPMGKMILLMWENRDRRSIPEFLLRPFLGWLGDLTEHYRNRCQELWDGFLPQIRVLILSENHDNLLMWSHYAQSHTGVVFAFRVLLEEDSATRVAKPVIYRKEPPSLFSEEQWVDFLLARGSIDPRGFFRDYTLVKSEIWSYEQEWRVWGLEPYSGQGLYSDYLLLPEEVEAVYFGCKIKSEDKEAIKAVLSKKYSKARLFQARRPTSEYRLFFDEE